MISTPVLITGVYKYWVTIIRKIGYDKCKVYLQINSCGHFNMLISHPTQTGQFNSSREFIEQCQKLTLETLDFMYKFLQV